MARIPLCYFVSFVVDFRLPDGEQIAKVVHSCIMARRPDFGEEKVWTTQELKEITHNLALLSIQGVREFYERAYRECRISGRDFPPARAVQELVQAWKLLRKWRRRE